MSKSVYFKGAVGMIEGKLHSAHDIHAPTAIVLHPDPTAGGSMNNKVSYTLYKAFVECGFNVLRINFRGVGASQGSISDFYSNAERAGLADVGMALDWLHKEFPSTSHYWVGGFSFGSWIGMHSVMRRPEIEFFVSVAPPVTTRSFAFLDPCPINGLVVQPEKDEIANVNDTTAMVSAISASGTEIEYSIIPNADHFLQDIKDKQLNYLDNLFNIVTDYINVKLAMRISKPIKKKRRRRKKKDDDIEL